MILVAELVALSLLQLAWCLYYGLLFRWRATPLGPVWLAKGGMLAVLWPLLTINQAVHLPSWVWSAIIGPGLLAATAAWLAVTVYVRRGHLLPRWLRRKRHGRPASL